MKTTRQFMNLILLGALAASSAFAQKNKNDIPAAITTAAPTRAGNLSSGDLGRRTIERRAVEAVIWGADFKPGRLLVAARQLEEPDAHAESRHDLPMPFYNTKDAGPMVLEIPPASDEESITGSIDDAWQEALEDVGLAGADKGNGGKYLILPPNYKDKTPDGYIVLPSQTDAGFALLRSNLKSGSDADIAKAVAYGKRVKFYPLSPNRRLGPEY